MQHPPRCPQCDKQMEQGYILDNRHGGFAQAEWIGGAPEKSFWQGLNIRGRTRIPIVTYRCPRCGLLQSYALA